MYRFSGASCTIAICRREARGNGAPLSDLQGGNGIAHGLSVQDVLVNPEILYGCHMKHQVLDAVHPRAVQQRAG